MFCDQLAGCICYACLYDDTVPLERACSRRSLPLTWTTEENRMSSRMARKNAEIEGGEKIGKQRTLRRRIRDTTRLLSRVS